MSRSPGPREPGQLRTVLVVSELRGRSGEENGLLASGRKRAGKVPSSWGGGERRGSACPAVSSCSGVGVELKLGRKLHPWTRDAQ